MAVRGTDEVGKKQRVVHTSVMSCLLMIMTYGVCRAHGVCWVILRDRNRDEWLHISQLMPNLTVSD